MRTVLISIKEKFWKLILSGEKSLEIRKSRPNDISYPFQVVCYISGRGIMGGFICDSIIKTNDYPRLSEDACLPVGEIFEYANGASGRSDRCIYGWHVKEGTPVEYDAAFRIETAGIKRPPQSWCYIMKYTANKVAYSFGNGDFTGMFNKTKEALEEAAREIEFMKKYPVKNQEIPKKVFVGKCEVFRPSLIGSGIDVIDAVQCQAVEEGGEWGEGYLSDATKEQVEELENALEDVFQKWIDKYGFEANFFTVPSFNVFTFDMEKSWEKETDNEPERKN